MSKQSLRLLLLEDNQDDVALIVRHVRRGYDLTYLSVDTASAFLSALDDHEWDLIIADYTLPGFSAPEAILMVQGKGIETPIIVVSGAIGEERVATVMRLGAVDYVTKEPRLIWLLPSIARTLLNAEVKRAKDRAEAALKDAYAALREAYASTLEGWVHALDIRDRETEGHTRRVTDLTVRLARSMGLDEETVEQMRRGALLHDIGKLGIPDRILLKTGPLTDDEWDIMKLHPVYAYEWLSPIEYLKDALDIPKCHHEKWDGTGYPQGLIGQAIPLAARIFMVVDAYDAMISERPYRLPWTIEQALGEIERESGHAFDPLVVETFALGIRSGALL